VSQHDDTDWAYWDAVIDAEMEEESLRLYREKMTAKYGEGWAKRRIRTMATKPDKFDREWITAAEDGDAAAIAEIRAWCVRIEESRGLKKAAPEEGTAPPPTTPYPDTKGDDEHVE
jgi:hypothetical protein